MPNDVCSWATKYIAVVFILNQQANQTGNWIEVSQQENGEELIQPDLV